MVRSHVAHDPCVKRILSDLFLNFQSAASRSIDRAAWLQEVALRSRAATFHAADISAAINTPDMAIALSARGANYAPRSSAAERAASVAQSSKELSIDGKVVGSKLTQVVRECI